MNRRLYFVLPDVATAKAVERDLLLARIEERRMHFLGPRDVDLEDLPAASNVQKSDMLHGALVGGAVGGLVGAGLGYALYRMPGLLGIEIGATVVLVLGLLGVVFGMWSSGLLIGSSTPNVHLKEFAPNFAKGQILLMLDIAKERVEEIRELIKGHFPQAEDHGQSPTMPAFP